MKNEGKRKIMPLLLTLTLILSVMVIVPQSSVADPFIGVFPDGINWKVGGLTCGDELTYKVTDRSLDPETDFILQIHNGTDWIEIENGESTDDGDLYIEFNAPGWADLDPNYLVDPTSNNGTGAWELRLWNDDTDVLEAGYEAQITIDNLYHIKVKYDGDWIDNFVYNTTYTPVYIYIYNWSGSKYVLADHIDFDVEILQPDGVTVLADYVDISTGIWDLDITDEDLDFRGGSGNLEYYLQMNVDDGVHTTTTAFPVLLDVTADYPSDAEWGDTITVTGYVKDGQGNGVGAYDVALFSPVDGGYALAQTATTYSTGRFSMSVETGYESDTWSAGTWYIGTWYNGVDPARVDENDKFEFPINTAVGFIRYYWFDLASDDNVDIEIESPDEIIDGFEQTINISCEWNNEAFNDITDEDAIAGNAWVHVTGLDCYYDGVEYTDDDIVVIDHTILNAEGDVSYCEFVITFNETGTGTFIVTHPHDNDELDWAQFNNTDLDHNISGTLDFQVGNAADFNMVVENMPDHVEIDDTGPCDWVNDSTYQEVEIYVYGDEEDDEMNATLHVKGAGLDFTIDEDDEIDDNEYLLDKDEGWYLVMISPKIGGTISITATNNTDNVSVTKDFKIKGLKGTVTTSEGDDLEISVENPETITVDIQSGDYTTVKISYFDENWDEIECELYDETGDGETEGEGLNGIFTCELEDEDIEDGVGYLVVVAGNADLYMYEIIEVAPVHDLEVVVLSPVNGTDKSLTVGLDHEDWELQIMGPNGDVIDDIDEVIGRLTDEDHDEDNPLQEIVFEERSGSKWEPDDELMPWFKGTLIITAVNNSGENEHDGNISFDVDCATITYMPGSITAGIDLENITIDVMGVDANGDPLPEGTTLYFHEEDDTGDLDFEDDIDFDEDGMAEWEIHCAGEIKTWINGTFNDNVWDEGNLTCGNFTVDWPVFDLNPATIYIGQANLVTITALDYMGDPIEHLNLTIWTGGSSFGVPDPVETNADGIVEFSISPEASGKANVTMVRDITYVDGILDWDINDAIVTDTYVTITSMKGLKVSVSKSPIMEGETLTVTVTSMDDPVADADVEFGETTAKTDGNGIATFTVPNPGVDSAVYTVMAEKTGYISAERSITVIKQWEIQITGPTGTLNTGDPFTVTIIAKGSPLAGAECTFEGTTKISDGDGKVTFTLPSAEGTFTVSASYGNYKTGTYEVTVKAGGIPGFELVSLIAAIGLAFILLRRRRN